MKACLPNPKAIRPATNWIGFGFSVCDDNGTSGTTKMLPAQWFGFVRKDVSDGDVILGIQTNINDFRLRDEQLGTVTTVFGNQLFIEVRFDETLKSTLAWKGRLDPILNELRDWISTRIIQERAEPS